MTTHLSEAIALLASVGCTVTSAHPSAVSIERAPRPTSAATTAASPIATDLDVDATRLLTHSHHISEPGIECDASTYIDVFSDLGSKANQGTISLVRTSSCKSGLAPSTEKFIAFAGITKVSAWRAYFLVVSKLMAAPPFLATLDLNSMEPDYACFEHRRSATKILGSGFEDNLYCLRISNSYEMGGLLTVMNITVSVALNPHGQYHDPDPDEMAKYVDVTRRLYATAILATCDLLHGFMKDGVCTMP